MAEEVINYQNFEFEKVPFENLKFWLDNPRVSDWFKEMQERPGEITDTDAKQYLVHGEGKEAYKIQKLAEGNWKNNLADELLVNKINPSGEYIVFEGNRRLGALHYIWETWGDLASTKEKFTDISCKVYNNLDEDYMHQLVKMYHGEGKKLSWTPYATALNNYLRHMSGTPIEKLGYQGKKNSIQKARTEIEAIKLMNRNGVTQKNRFSYFLVYQKFLEQKVRKDSEQLLLDKIFPDDKEVNLKKLEYNLVQVFLSDRKNHGAINVRKTLKEVSKSKLGQQKLRAFVQSGDFDTLQRWAEGAAPSGNAEKVVSGIADDLWNHRDIIEKAMEKSGANLGKRNKMRQLLRKIYASLSKYDPELFPEKED